MASIYNFALDEECAYIAIPCYESLDGYAVLKFEKEYVDFLQNVRLRQIMDLVFLKLLMNLLIQLEQILIIGLIIIKNIL